MAKRAEELGLGGAEVDELPLLPVRVAAIIKHERTQRSKGIAALRAPLHAPPLLPPVLAGYLIRGRKLWTEPWTPVLAG